MGCSAHGLGHQPLPVGTPGALLPSARGLWFSYAWLTGWEPWIAAMQLPELGRRSDGKQNLAIPVNELKCQPADGPWPLTSQAVSRGGY